MTSPSPFQQFFEDRTGQLFWISSTLFFSASFLGFWLIISILRSGRLR